ncbi:hypothetical protein HK101_007449 [Irineochytrium annulatum]|nr:hypothetical protein HK101_007449 [Irineochytrium annulatum]
MEQEEPELLRQLFKENNELRLKTNALQRELYNKIVQNELAEDENRQLKLKIENGETGSSRPQTQAASKKSKAFTGEQVLPSTQNGSKELQEALFVLERKSTEIKQMRDESTKLQSTYEELKGTSEVMEREMNDMRNELTDLRTFKVSALKELESAQQTVEVVVPDDVAQLRSELESKDALIVQLRKQAIDVAVDANRKYNDQQNQLQGVESLIEGIRKEYDEFIQVTKLETESFRKQQQGEFNDLKQQFESHKLSQFDEKKRLMTEYAGLLYSMQSQFEEYRITAEYMFNAEMEKLEDELSMQAMRYEHEIMYVLQSKDKFYADMMVSKDAKIMNLIEGSDLQALIQKHELDMENLRKDHAREIERVKSDQESEQKNLIALLQRQNVSLESKCEKLQAHLKTLEMRIRELMGIIETKNKTLSDKEEQKMKMEAEFEAQVSEAHAKIASLHHEKEHLRHKIIRLNLNAKGEGENSIENMLKRISRETADLHGEFEQIGSKYDSLLGENQVLQKRLKEREKFAEFMEKQVAKRSEEYIAMSRVEFPQVTKEEAEEEHSERTELARGTVALKRFKALSRAYATGDFRIVPTGQYENSLEGPPDLWQKTRVYGKLDDVNLAMARLYKEKKTLEPERPALYKPEVPSSGTPLSDIKLYENKSGVTITPIKMVEKVDDKNAMQNSGPLAIGGVAIAALPHATHSSA